MSTGQGGELAAAESPERRRLPKVNGVDGTTVTVAADAGTLGDTFGTQLPEAGLALLDSVLLPFHASGALDANKAIGLVAELKPRDAAEAMLATNAVIAYKLSAQLAAQALDSKPRRNQLGLAQTALAASKTMARLLTALNKRKRGPVTTQRVVVERVNVGDGGQAIVGAVDPGGAVGKGGGK